VRTLIIRIDPLQRNIRMPLTTEVIWRIFNQTSRWVPDPPLIINGSIWRPEERRLAAQLRRPGVPAKDDSSPGPVVQLRPAKGRFGIKTTYSWSEANQPFRVDLGFWSGSDLPTERAAHPGPEFPAFGGQEALEVGSDTARTGGVVREPFGSFAE